ncbi:MAG: hypothetical protein H6760_02560 [Candidatus Nomurabacteria bacterium]|nr:MAG: hypothetical protein H6760_02560 [Candidatus Nomurabacteria bacterium]
MSKHFSSKEIIKLLKMSHSQSLSPAARERIEARLRMAASSVTVPEADRYKQRSGFFLNHKNMIASILIAIVLLGSGTGTVLAANNAKPGDWLFGIDQAVEQVRLNLATSAEARLRIQAEIAAERAKELAELEQEQKEQLARDAADHVNSALQNAQQTVAEVRDELEAKENEHAAATLSNVEVKLREIEDAQNSHSLQRIEIEVHVAGAQAFVQAEVANQHSEFTLTTTDREEIIKAVTDRLGLSEAQVRAAIKIEYDGVDLQNANSSDDHSDTNDDHGNDNKNTHVDATNSHEGNVNDDTNSHNSNSNSNDSEDHGDEEEAQWEIEVRVREDGTEIKARRGDTQRYEWTSANTSTSSLAQEIATRTGLSASQVQALWDFEIDN